MAEDREAQEAIEERGKAAAAKETPRAGPHAKKELTDPEKTPGAGALPQDGGPEADVGSD